MSIQLSRKNLIIFITIFILLLIMLFFKNNIFVKETFNYHELIKQLVVDKDLYTSDMSIHNIQRMIMSTILLGMILVIIILNIILSIRIRDKVNIFVALMFICMFLFQLSLSGVLSLFNKNMDIYLATYRYVFINIMIIILAGLTQTFLDYNYFKKNEKRILKIFFIGPVIPIILLLMGRLYVTVVLTGLIIIAIAIYILIVSIRQIFEYNSRNAKFLIAILFTFLIGGVMSIGKYMNYIDTNFFTQYALLICSTISISIILYSSNDRLFSLHQTNEELKKSKDSLTMLSLTDDLTRLYNRRYFNDRIEYEVDQAEITGKPLTLMLLDIDHFKKFNDTYGHHEGDKALTKLAKILMDNIRQTDYACRYGGEEFAIILPDTSKLKADKYVADRIHRALAKNVFAFTRKGKVFITISIGICELQASESAQTLLEHTDLALYKAKELGRNRTVIYKNVWKNI